MIDILLNIDFSGKSYSDESFLKDFISIQKKFFNDFVSDEDLGRFADDVQGTIERNLYTGNTYTGDSAAPLSPGTIKQKGHSKVFFWTGSLYRSIAKQKIPNGYELFVLPARAAIAAMLNYGTKYLPERPFWGIMPARADALIEQMLYRGERRMAA